LFWLILLVYIHLPSLFRISSYSVLYFDASRLLDHWMQLCSALNFFMNLFWNFMDCHSMIW
jgi:hypothetical protein